MKVAAYADVKSEDAGPDTRGATIRWLISEADGAPNFAMRLFELEPGGYTPLHSHDWEHEVFIVEGKGALVGEGGKEKPFNKGDFAFIPGGETHQFANSGSAVVRILCLIPHNK
ncbi:MAG: cupin domain-containing protein [bacterium]